LLLAALRFDAITHPQGHPLGDALRSQQPSPEAVTRQDVVRALDPGRLPLWLAVATRKVQTNDVSRAVAWRWPAAFAGTRPIVLVDIGCSAGLNLVADGLTAPWTRSDGQPLALGTPVVLERIGFDKNPVDPNREDEAQWLRACIWPGDHERLARLDAALATMRARADSVSIERVSARHVVGRLRRIEQAAPAGVLVLAYQTFVREYVEAGERAVYLSELDAWLRELPRGRALMVELELAEQPRTPPADLVARPSRHDPILLARCSYHPTVLDVDDVAVSELASAIARD
jgi:hypothetical protein